jgi:hypothetical protein
MTDQRQEIEAVLRRAEEIFQTAKHGFEDLTGPNRARRFTGLRNLIVFGRSITFVLQNLRSIVREQFDEWYAPKQEEMRKDPLMRYFVDARNEVLKQGKLNVATHATIHHLLGRDFKKFGPPPPGAVNFVIGDSLGGTGWEVQLLDGTKEMYYIELPTELGTVTQHFANLPEANDPQLKGKAVEELCDLYLRRLEALLDDARQHFLDEKVQRVGERRLPPYLRVIK